MKISTSISEPGTTPTFSEPLTEAELAAVLAEANSSGLRVTPRGGGTKMSWGNPPSQTDLILSTRRLNRILEYEWADLTVTVEAGCTIVELQNTLAAHGQRIAVDPLWPEAATVGGMLSTNDTGALRLRFGSLRDLIIGATVCLADGTVARSGGKVVKNVAGYDLPKLVTGALGTLGVITQAVFRLHSIPAITRTLSIAVGSLAEMQVLLRAIQQSRLTPAALQMTFAADTAAQMDVLFEGADVGVNYQTEQLCALAPSLAVTDGDGTTWKAREQLLSGQESYAAAKLSVLPSAIASVTAALHTLANNKIKWRLLWYGTGIGWLRLEGEDSLLLSLLQELRAVVEKGDGSLTVVRQPRNLLLDAWGDVGDVKTLMQAVKNQFDPKATLNRGRFAAGI